MIKRIKEKKTTTHINYDNDGDEIGKTIVTEEVERTEEIMNDYPDGDVIQCNCDSCDDKHCNNPEDCLCDECLVDDSCSVKCASGAARDGAIPEGVDFIGCKDGCSCNHGQDDGPKMSLATYLSTLAAESAEAQGVPPEPTKPKQVKFVTIPDKVLFNDLVKLLATLSGK